MPELTEIIFARTLWDEFSDFRCSSDQVFDSFYSSARRANSADRSDWTFSPGIETGWTDDYLNPRVVIPGVAAGDLKTSIQGNQLIIQGERKAPKDFGKEGSLYNQLAYGKFERTIELPSGVDVEKL